MDTKLIMIILVISFVTVLIGLLFRFGDEDKRGTIAISIGLLVIVTMFGWLVLGWDQKTIDLGLSYVNNGVANGSKYQFASCRDGDVVSIFNLTRPKNEKELDKKVIIHFWRLDGDGGYGVQWSENIGIHYEILEPDSDPNSRYQQYRKELEKQSETQPAETK